MDVDKGLNYELNITNSSILTRNNFQQNIFSKLSLTNNLQQ